MAAVRTQLAEMGSAGIRLTLGEPAITDKDTFVLVADRPTLHLADGATTRVRLTLALSRVDRALLIQQMHLSAPARNEDVVHQTLTI